MASLELNPRNVEERDARRQLIELAKKMLSRELSFIEGAPQVLRLRWSANVRDDDPDFMAFVAIESETDHLPLEAQKHLWSPAALAKLAPEFEHVESWASQFADVACKKLITRLSGTLMECT